MKFKHYATDEIIEIENPEIVKDKLDRVQLKGTSFFKIEKEVGK